MEVRPSWTVAVVAVLTVAACTTGPGAAGPVPGRVPGTPSGLAPAPERRTLAGCALDVARDTADADGDGLGEDCEFALAAAFAPLLVVDSTACNFVRPVSGSGASWEDAASPGRLEGGYLFAVEPADGAVRIVYLPAYTRDCGWSGLKCVVALGDCEGHAGDSEVVAVDVVDGQAEAEAGGWRAVAVFLSAHCEGEIANAHGGGGCRWYRGEELGRFRWPHGRGSGATVWVSSGKNANYPSRAACDAGHYALDTCDANTAVYRFPVASTAQNIGSREGGRRAAGARCLATHEVALLA
ncbi:MAG: hypothetical protein ACRELV_07260, partial [Longimicrobiales bacterium]